MPAAVFETPNGKLWYSDTGQPDNSETPPIVALHGFFMDHTIFRPQEIAFQHKHRFITIDAFGHGNSDPGKPNLNYWQYAQYVADILTSLDIGKAIWMGHSQGGFAALRAALTVPERVAAMILIATEAKNLNTQEKEDYEQMFSTWESPKGPPKNVLDALAQQLLGDQQHWGSWPEKWPKTSYDTIKPAIDCLLNRDDLSSRLSKIFQPALVIGGENDQAIPAQTTRTLAETLSGASEALILPSAAHTPNLTHPQQVNTAIKTFITNLETDSQPASTGPVS